MPSDLLTPPAYRACDLCQYGEGPQGKRTCAHPDAKPAPVEIVRAKGGACGPEGYLLHIATWGKQ